MQFCSSCNQNVRAEKKFSIGWFLVNCFWVIGGGVYLLYWMFLKGKSCPICGNKNLHNHR